VRDWLFVTDHCSAIREVLAKGRVGEVYNVGGNSEKQNIEVVTTLCALLDELAPRSNGKYADQITYVKDRPGHDRRYAIDATKIRHELRWEPAHRFEAALRETVKWYLANDAWVKDVQSGEYRKWIATNYAERAR
jgi:dTDP-glucose 4,6-dehydratase